GFLYNTSVMDPQEQWRVLTMAILLGGHVRVGMEDKPIPVSRPVCPQQRSAGREDRPHFAGVGPRHRHADRGAKHYLAKGKTVTMARINAVSFHEDPCIESICRRVRAAGFDSLEVSRPPFFTTLTTRASRQRFAGWAADLGLSLYGFDCWVEVEPYNQF